MKKALIFLIAVYLVIAASFAWYISTTQSRTHCDVSAGSEANQRCLEERWKTNLLIGLLWPLVIVEWAR